jgi:hypothetical protein
MKTEYYYEMEQGTDPWHEARLGMVTASEINKIVTPKGKVKIGKEVGAYACEIASQRENMQIEDTFQSFDMMRGQFQEVIARDIYNDNYNEVHECGFIVADFGGFKIGGSPDGLVELDGGVEIKSRLAKFQVSTIVADEVPDEYINQIQAMLLITGREWWDFVQYSNGMPLFVKRVYPDEARQETIIKAVKDLEPMIEEMRSIYQNKSTSMVQTERVEFMSDDYIEESEGE